MAEKYVPGQKVDLEILRETNLGFVAKVNGAEEGLLYHNEVFEVLEAGQKLPGYIKKVREDGRIDLLLQPFGNFGSDELGQRIMQVLAANNGFLPIDAKTSAERIYELFGVSKKKYKIAIGGLYKKKMITIGEDGIRINVQVYD